MTMRVTAVCALLALALVTLPASARPTTPKVEILFVTPDALTDVALDGNHVAWTGDCLTDSASPARISARSLSGGPKRTITPTTGRGVRRYLRS